MTLTWQELAQYYEKLCHTLNAENRLLQSQRDALIAANRELQRALFELLEMADEEPAAGDDHADTRLH